MSRAELAEIRRAVDAADAYLAVERVSLQEAVDVACDRERIVLDADRRIVRHFVRQRADRRAGEMRRRRVG